MIHDDLGTNKSYTWDLKVEGHDGQIDEAFAAAAFTVSEQYVQQRLIPMAMEPAGSRRSAAAVRRRPDPVLRDAGAAHPQDHDRADPGNSRAAGARHRTRRSAAASVRSSTSTRKSCCASRWPASTRVPVRWNEERSENAQATIQGRGQIQNIELAADADGKLTAVRVRLLADMGAYLQLVTPGIPLLGAFLYAGVYDLPVAYDFSCTSVFTNMTPTDAYRGAGRPEATYAIERAMDSLAGKMGVDPVELRRRNFVRKEQFPYTAFSGLGLRLGRSRRRGRPRRSAWPTTTVFARRQKTQNVAGRTQTARHRCQHLLRDVRTRPVAGARLAELRAQADGRQRLFVCCRPARSRSSPARHRTARGTRRRGA